MTTLTTDTLDRLRVRRSAGESLATLAADAGVSWQRLWGLLNGSTPTTTTAAPKVVQVTPCTTKAMPLVEKYRPRRLDDILGQAEIVARLRAFAASPYPVAMLFAGGTGTGKSSAAIALAAAIGCDIDQQPPEFGGLHVIASGEQKADNVREAVNVLWTRPFYGSGWRVLVVNEADCMSKQAEAIWLDRLENLPAKSVVIFTTNWVSELSPRFRDRCERYAFLSASGPLGMDAMALLAGIWRAETGAEPDMSAVARAVDAADNGETLSFRRAVQALAPELARTRSKS